MNFFISLFTLPIRHEILDKAFTGYPGMAIVLDNNYPIKEYIKGRRNPVIHLHGLAEVNWETLFSRAQWNEINWFAVFGINRYRQLQDIKSGTNIIISGLEGEDTTQGSNLYYFIRSICDSGHNVGIRSIFITSDIKQANQVYEYNETKMRPVRWQPD